MNVKKITIENLINLSAFLYILSIYLLTYREGLNTVSNAIALMMVACIWINIILSRKPVVFNKFLFFFLVFIFICLFSAFYAINQYAVMEKVRTLFLIFLVMVSLVNYVDTFEKLKKVLIFFVLAGAITSIYILLSSDFSEAARFGGDIGNVNAIGMNIGISSILCFLMLLREKKFWYALLFVTMIPCILLTGSRKSLIFVSVNVILILYLQNRKSLRKLVKFCVISICLLLVFYYLIFYVPYFYEIIGKRMENLISFASGKGSNEGSINIRYNMALAGFELFKYRPFTGYGIDNYRFLYAGTYSHNNFIEIMVGTGILGVVFYYLSHVILLKEIFSVSKSTDDKIIYYAFIALIISFIILSPSMVYYYDKHINFILALVSSAIVFSKKRLNISESLHFKT